jgi:DNA-binding transcriptional ArsR family regulator
MDREYLKHCLDQGLSLSEIGVLVNRDPSTVGYWVRKHGLVANGRAKHAPRGGLKREQLEPLVEQRLSLGQIADTLGVSVSTVRHWLKKHGFPTDLAYRRRKRRLVEAGLNGVRKVEMDCRNHGIATFVLDSRGSWRCLQCRADAVAARRRRVKQTLVDEAGGKCQLCGYNRHVAALHCHHLDPKEKTFSIAHDGVTRGIDVMREEVKKCVLLCATPRGGGGRSRYASGDIGHPDPHGCISRSGGAGVGFWRSAVNREVVGSIPTPGVQRRPCGPGLSC